MKISIRSQGQWFLSTQSLLQHLKNTGKHTFGMKVKVLFLISPNPKNPALRSENYDMPEQLFFFFFFCIWRTHVGKHKLNKPNSWNLPVIMLTLPSCWECQSESQCWLSLWRCIVSIIRLSPAQIVFCRNKLSKICIMEIWVLHEPTT